MIRKRKRLSGFLILALALAARYAVVPRGPDFVPYTTDFFSDGNEKVNQQVRVSLLIPAGWVKTQEIYSGLIFHPRPRLTWMPLWLRKWFVSDEKIPDPPGSEYLAVWMDSRRSRPMAGDSSSRLFEHVVMQYSRADEDEFYRTREKVLGSARIVERRPLNR